METSFQMPFTIFLIVGYCFTLVPEPHAILNLKILLNISRKVIYYVKYNVMCKEI